jgi:hypothetical protein
VDGARSPTRHLKTGKRKKEKGEQKRKRGREPTIVIVFFHITTIVGESSQKLNKIGKTFLSSRFQERTKVLNKRRKPEKVRKKTKNFFRYVEKDKNI